jgi:hypothetical protein
MFIMAALAVCLTLLACGKSDQAAAHDTTVNFMSALNSGDRQALDNTLTLKARDAMKDSKLGDNKKENGDYNVGDAKVDGDNAEVPVTVKDSDSDKTHDIKVKLRREANEWRVYAMVIPTDSAGGDLTIDFEHPEAIVGDVFQVIGKGVGSLLKGVGEGLGAMFEGLGRGLRAAGK